MACLGEDGCGGMSLRMQLFFHRGEGFQWQPKEDSQSCDVVMMIRCFLHTAESSDWYRKLFAHGFKNSLPFKEILAQGSKQPPAQIVTCTRLRTASSTESVMYTALLDRCTRLQRASHTNVCCTRLQNQPPVQRNRCTRLQTASCTWTPRRTQTSACKSRLSYPKSLVTMLIRNQQAFHKVYSEVPTQTMVRQNISI